MAKLDMKREVLAFAGIVFLLLGVLFGMQIMTFIFGNLGTTSSIFPATSFSVINESGTITSTPYELANNAVAGFSLVTINATNVTDGSPIDAGNFTVTSSGTITNTTSLFWDTVNFIYVYNADSEAKIASDSVTNDSLESIATYTNQSNTQFNTAAIAITLLLLIAIFAIFWKIFMSKGGISGDSGGGGGGRGGRIGGVDGEARNFS